MKEPNPDVLESQPPLLYPYWHQSFTAQDRLGKIDLDLIGPWAEEFKRG